MSRFIAFLVLLTVSAPLALVASEFGCPQCRSCGGACVLTAEPVTEDETCYEIECKEVCIPAVRFPWESCQTPKCGRVRLVHRLKRVTRETQGCEYKWVVVCSRCGRVEQPADTPKAKADVEKPVPPASTTPPTPPAAPGTSQLHRTRIRDARIRPTGGEVPVYPEARGEEIGGRRSSTR